MKTRFHFLILLILAMIMSHNVYSQAINSLEIIPSNPTPEDSVKVIASVWLPSGDCWLEMSGVSLAGQDIQVVGGYDAGMLTVICNSTDTVTLGKFEPGTYHCNYNLVYPFYTSAIDDMMTIDFTVGNNTSIYNDEKLNADLFLKKLGESSYSLNYKLPNGEFAQELHVYDSRGSLLYAQNLDKSNLSSITIPLQCNTATLIISIITESGKRFSKLFSI